MAKMGRPKKGAASKKTAPLAFRVRADLRADLQRAADEAGHSLSREIEWRLEHGERLTRKLHQIKDDFGGEFFALMCIARKAIRQIEMTVGKKWFEDPWVSWVATSIVYDLFQLTAPDGEIQRPEHLFVPEDENAPPDAPRLYGGTIEESELPSVLSGAMLFDIMQTPQYDWLDKLSAKERAEWDLMAEKGDDFDLWIRKTLGAVGENVTKWLGPLALTPERLRRRVAIHREKRLDAQGYKERVEREAREYQQSHPAYGFLPGTPPAGVVLGSGGKQVKPGDKK